jgi:hypothetical protein
MTSFKTAIFCDCSKPWHIFLTSYVVCKCWAQWCSVLCLCFCLAMSPVHLHINCVYYIMRKSSWFSILVINKSALSTITLHLNSLKTKRGGEGQTTYDVKNMWYPFTTICWIVSCYLWSRNCIPFRSTWFHTRFRLWFMLLDLQFC